MTKNIIDFKDSHLPSKRYQVSIADLNKKEAKELIRMIWFAKHDGDSKATVTDVVSSGRAWSLSETKAKEEGEG
jgi:hypothetical protein